MSEAMPTTRFGPLHQRHVDSGARMGDFAGWTMPLEYAGGGVLREHAAVRGAVGVFDVSHLGTVAVRGRGARAVVDAVLTNDTARLVPGRSQYSLACTPDGGIIDDLLIYLRADDDILTIPNTANAAALALLLRRAAIAVPGTEVVDEHEDWAVLAVQGPRCEEVLGSLGLPVGLAPGAFVQTTWRGIPLLAARTGYTGERGYELLPPWSRAAPLWDALLEAATALGGRPAGLAARDVLRTEVGYPLHGHELGPDVSPLQARLGWAVGWGKAAFTGRDALLAERRAGPVRRLQGILALERGVPRAGMEVRAPGSPEPVGRTTSGTFSPILGAGIALALLDASVTEGSEVTLDVRGRPVRARVVRPPFVPDRSRA